MAPKNSGRRNEVDRRAVHRLRVDPGLCATCRHLRLLASPRSVFVRCALAEKDPDFSRYPPLPVLECSGWSRAEPDPPLSSTE